jgi:hypothetical protein
MPGVLWAVMPSITGRSLGSFGRAYSVHQMQRPFAGECMLQMKENLNSAGVEPGLKLLVPKRLVGQNACASFKYNEPSPQPSSVSFPKVQSTAIRGSSKWPFPKILPSQNYVQTIFLASSPQHHDRSVITSLILSPRLNTNVYFIC